MRSVLEGKERFHGPRKLLEGFSLLQGLFLPSLLSQHQLFTSTCQDRETGIWTLCLSLRAIMRHWGSAQPFKTEKQNIKGRWRQIQNHLSHMSSLRKPAWATHEALIWFKTKQKTPQTNKQTSKTYLPGMVGWYGSLLQAFPRQRQKNLSVSSSPAWSFL